MIRSLFAPDTSLRSCQLVVLVLIGFAAAQNASADPSIEHDWPSFRGAEGHGIAADAGGLSGMERFSLRTAWKKRIGSGYSGISVAGPHVVTMFSDGTSDVMVNLDAKDGRERWRFEIGPTYRGHDGSHDGPIATPVIADGRVFGLGANGRLFAVALDTGELQWSTHLAEDQGADTPFYGFGTSPILRDGVLIVAIGAKDAAVAGFDPETGKRIWSVGGDGVAYQSPIACTWSGRDLVLAPSQKHLFALTPKDGRIVWQYDLKLDGERGSVSAVPVLAGAQRIFLAHKNDKSIVVEPKRESETVAVHPVWEERTIRSSYNVPVYHDGYIYGYTGRILTCVNAATGGRMWRDREPGDGFTILADGHLVIVTKKGTLHVAPASPSGYKEAAALALFEDVVWTPPSYAHDSIYVRSHGEIAKVDIDKGAATVAADVDAEGMLPDSKFGRFVAKVQEAKEKEPLIDEFMGAQGSFPIIEGRNTAHFVYRGSGTDPGIAGDMFGARQDRPMNRVAGTDLYYYSMRLEPDARLNYVLMKDYQTMPDPRNSRTTTTILFDEEMEMSFSGQELEMSWFAMPDWRAPTFLEEPDPSRKGRTESHELESEALGKKHKIDVYLPRGYDEGADGLPVMYVHGGAQAMTRGLYPRALDNLIGRRVAPVIAVFIHEPSFRQTEQYTEMFAKELIPFIDKTYRTIASAEGRASVGAGLSGSDAWYCVLKHPGLVGRVGTQSMFLLDSFTPDVAGLLTSAKKQPLQICLDWGAYDFRNPHENWDMGDVNRRFAEKLRAAGYTFAGGEAHDGTGWSSWRTRVDRMFEALLPVR